MHLNKNTIQLHVTSIIKINIIKQTFVIYSKHVNLRMKKCASTNKNKILYNIDRRGREREGNRERER